MSSSSKTPNANTSVFSSTTPCIKYSGAKYLQTDIDTSNVLENGYNEKKIHKSKSRCNTNPNVPSIGKTTWCAQLFGSHFASPKSDI